LFSVPAARIVVGLLFGALLLIGFGMMALMAPFAGLDEIAHYSRIDAIAFDAPKTKAFYVSADSEACSQLGPMPHNWIVIEAFNGAFAEVMHQGKDHGPLRFKEHLIKQGHVDYHAFFAGDPGRVKAFTDLCRDAEGKPFSPGTETNWEFQHPPLFYVLFGQLLRLAPKAPVISRLLLMRFASFALVFLGFCGGVLATWRHFFLRRDPRAQDIAVFGAFFPFLLPAFFGEFARVGNDALCLFVFAGLWALALLYLRRPQENFLWAALGVVAGYGWLTKVTMVATSGGLFLFMALQPPAREPGAKPPANRLVALGLRLLPALTAGLIAFVIGVTPYIPQGGHVTGSYEFNGWLHGQGFLQPNTEVPWGKILSAELNLFTTMAYGFSDVFPDLVTPVVLIGIPVVLAGLLAGWALGLPRDPRREEWLPVYVVTPLAAGVASYGVFSAIAYRVTGITPGHYMHILSPALAAVAGAGFCRWTRRRPGRLAAGALLVGSGLAALSIVVEHAETFAGCRWQTGSSTQDPVVSDHCAWGLIFDRLDILAWPRLGLTLVIPGFALLLTAIALMLAALWRQDAAATRKPG
jgi:hypothetical protein